ncbi:hypothetical protein E1A91_A11G021600v1 [Gossypium mustelinum]|uniref:Bifunctional inhibitor/plant lipid transfer protein/seed storage helical domain-containing protein n=1 Tax=Gossypium mustelinum TaxID=34275 RepID=A0A5D2X1F3_GOSMU|nr:hypothetical protein E1A91_A11G021600v1 [Gossypium mustelinum]
MANLMIMAVLLVAVSTAATVTDAQATCAAKLVSCSRYILNTTIKPQDDCCNPIKEEVTNDLSCLCNLYKDPKVFASLNISIAQALNVTRECGVTTDLTACNSNSTSTSSATSPPGGRSADQNGRAERISLTGVTILFFFSISMAL